MTQGALTRYTDAACGTKYRHSLPALVKLCSAASLHGNSPAAAGSFHSAVRAALQSEPLSAERAPAKYTGLIHTVPSFLLSLSFCSGSEANTASLLADCLARSYLHDAATFNAARTAMKRTASTSASTDSCSAVFGKFAFQGTSGVLSPSAQACLRKPQAAAQCLAALQQLNQGSAFSAPCSANAACVFLAAHVESEAGPAAGAGEATGGGLAQMQEATLWAAEHACRRARVVALQVCCSWNCWRDSAVLHRCLQQLDDVASHMTGGAIQQVAVNTASSRTLIRTGALLAKCCFSMGASLVRMPSQYLAWLLACMRDPAVSGAQFEECCWAATLFACQASATKWRCALVGALVAAVSRWPLQRAPAVLQVLQRALRTCHMHEQQRVVCAVFAKVLAVYAAYIPIVGAASALDAALHLQSSRARLCVDIMQSALQELTTDSSQDWILGTEAVPAGFGSLVLPSSSKALPAKDFVLGFLSPDVSPRTAQLEGLQAALHLVLASLSETHKHPPFCVQQALQDAKSAAQISAEQLGLVCEWAKSMLAS